MSLAVGPKHCDLEARDYKTRKSLGRVAFDLHVKQTKMSEIILSDLKCTLNYKEEKPLHGIFKLITGREAP